MRNPFKSNKIYDITITACLWLAAWGAYLADDLPDGSLGKFVYTFIAIVAAIVGVTAFLMRNWNGHA
jgi:hypothetical protein